MPAITFFVASVYRPCGVRGGDRGGHRYSSPLVSNLPWCPEHSMGCSHHADHDHSARVGAAVERRRASPTRSTSAANVPTWAPRTLSASRDTPIGARTSPGTESVCGCRSRDQASSVTWWRVTSRSTRKWWSAAAAARREDVWSADRVRVAPHPIGERASALGVDWPVAVEIDVDDAWRPGWYQVELVTKVPGAEPIVAQAGFVVRAPSDRPSSPMLLVLDDQHLERVQRLGRAEPVHR